MIFFLEGSCGSTLVERQGWFSLDNRNYIEAYNQTLDCWWTILANDRKQIQLYISGLDMWINATCCLDVIKVSFLFQYVVARRQLMLQHPPMHQRELVNNSAMNKVNIYNSISTG